MLTIELSLAHFELGVLFADNIKTAFALYNLAILAALLDGCFYFHNMYFLFVSERNSSFGQIIRRNLNLDSVSRENLNIIHPHLA